MVITSESQIADGVSETERVIDTSNIPEDRGAQQNVEGAWPRDALATPTSIIGLLLADFVWPWFA